MGNPRRGQRVLRGAGKAAVKLRALAAPLESARIAYRRWVTPRVVRRRGVVLGRGVGLLGTPVVSMAPGSRIEIGDRCVLCSDSRCTALGVAHPVVLRALRPGALIRIGADTGISGASICAALSVEIGAHCLLGADVLISDTDFHALDPNGRRYNADAAAILTRAVWVEDNVFIGARAIVLKGVRIGTGSVVGAGAVVTRDVPAGVVVAGNPARVIGRVPGAAAVGLADPRARGDEPVRGGAAAAHPAGVRGTAP